MAPSGSSTVISHPFFYVADEAFNGSLGKRMTGFAQFCVKTNIAHKELIVLLPHGMTLPVPAKHDAPHVVRKDFLWHPHAKECVDHAYKQVFLLGVGEEFHVALAADFSDPLFPSRQRFRHVPEPRAKHGAESIV